MSHLHAWLKHKFLLRVKNFQVRLWCWIYFHMFSQFSVSTRDHTSTILSSHSKTKWCYRTQTSSLARQYLFSSSFVSSSPRILVEALLTATYLINRYPSSIFFGCFPFEVCFHQKHDYFALRPFGCTCFVLLSPHECSKLSPNAVICHFLGYGMEHKGFKCFDPKAICLRVSYHVSFRKHIPFYSLLTASI